MHKIYPQRFLGKYRTIKDLWGVFLLLIYMCGAWVPYHRGYDMPNQAMLIDLPARKAYLFGIIIWPDELYYLTFTLILSAMGLFIVTSLFGRIWCGYTCPHTVMTDLFMMVETLLQGDRNARMKLDAMTMSADKFIRKTLTHLVWLLFSFLFAFGWVGYFYDVKNLLSDLLHGCVSTNGALWLVVLTSTTYMFAGFLRQRVCVYMCPYGRFQSAMVDNDTLLVTYNAWRGEPRGQNHHDDNVNYGDCIDCERCVIACPMGIDIRNGLQMPCIGCGLCIDACDSVMEKLNRPKGLIEYISMNSAKYLEKRWHSTQYKTILYHQLPHTIRKIFSRPKVLMYCCVFAIASSVFLYALINKSSIILQVDKMHSPLFTLTPDRSIRNTYSINILNKRPIPQDNMCLSVDGLEGALIDIQGVSQDYARKSCFKLQPGQTLEAQMIVLLPYKTLRTLKTNGIAVYRKIDFILQSDEGKILGTTEGRFYIKN